MRILITGAGGMLGSALVPALARAGHEVIPTDIRLAADTPREWSGLWVSPMEYLDVRARHQIADGIAQVQPHMVMHLAAETDVDRCESEPDHAYLTNALGTKYVALACHAAGLPLVYISTAGVFDGEKDEPYTEFDRAIPINVYGRSKLAGEEFVRTFLDRFYIVRAGWMVGGGDKDHKFVAKILQQLNDGATTLHVVTDKLGTPTYAPDFARCLAELIRTESYGLYHMACLGRGTRYDVAKKILEVLGRAHDVALVEVGSGYFQDQYPAPRPRSEMMRNMMLDLQQLNTMRHWEEALEEYLLTAFADLRVSASPVQSLARPPFCLGAVT